MNNFGKFDLRRFEGRVLDMYKTQRPQMTVSEAVRLFDGIYNDNGYETYEKTETIESIENDLIKKNRLTVNKKGMYKTSYLYIRMYKYTKLKYKYMRQFRRCEYG